MIEKTLYDYLKSKLKGISVHMEFPANPPGKFVTIQKLDGGKRIILMQPHYQWKLMQSQCMRPVY